MGHIVNAENRHLRFALFYPSLTFILLLTGSKSVISAFECVVQGRRVFGFFLFCFLQFNNNLWGGGAVSGCVSSRFHLLKHTNAAVQFMFTR